MTKTQTKTAFDAFVADMNAAQSRVQGAEHGAADMAVHLAHAVSDAAQGGNYPALVGTVTRVVDKKTTQVEITVDVDRMTKLAQGGLSQQDVTETLDALASLSPKVAEARTAYSDLLASVKGDKTARALLDAEIAAAKTKAHTMTQTLRRPLRAAAFLIASPQYDVASAEAKTHKGSRVIMVDRTIKAGDAEVTKRVSLSTVAIDKGLTEIATKAGNAPTKRKTKVSTANAEAAPVGPNVKVIDAKTFSRDPKRNVGDVMHHIAEGLADMEDAFKPTERDEAIALILSLAEKLDAQGMAELTKELRKIKA